MTIGTQDYYILDSPEDIAWLARVTTYNNSSIQGKTFVIASSTPIDLIGRYFTPINSGYSNSFNIIGISKNSNEIVASDLLEGADVDNVVIKGMTIDSNVNIAIGSDNSLKSAFINQISNAIIRGLDFVDVDILTSTYGATIVGTVNGASNIANCNYISGDIYGYNNININNSNNTIVSGLAYEISDSTTITSSSVTGYALQDDETYRLHESYEFGNDLGGGIWALNGYVNASGMVANVNNSAKLQESYFNGIIYIYNTENSHTGYVLNANSTVQNNYVKGQINSYYQNENISGLVSIIYSNAQIINNYVATEFNLTSGNTRFIYSIDTSATNYTVTKNYYLVDTTSTPKIGVGLTNTTTNSTTDVTENIIQISSSDLRNQNKFKNESTWDFDDIWIYVNHINWDYPVLRSIFGGDTTDIEVTIYNPYKYGDDNTQLGNLSLDSNNILYINSTTSKVESLYGDIVDSQEFTDTSELKFTYSIITNEVGNFIVSNTSNGLITSVLFGELNKAGTKVGDITLTDDQTNYTEYATTDNADVVITQNINKECYGLVITFNERIFNVTVNATLTADTGTDGVQDSDYMTILLVHKNSSSIVDWAYSVNLHNNQSFKFENIYNGIYGGKVSTGGL